MVQITKDEAYDAVAPDDFPRDAGDRPLRRALDRVRQDHLRDPRPFLGSARQEVHRLQRAVRHRERDDPAGRAASRSCSTARRRQADGRPEDQASPTTCTLLAASRRSCMASRARSSLSASLCHILRDPGAQEYAANQTREEARHVTAFAKYIKPRWGTPLPCGAALRQPADRNRRRAGGLQEDRRHADAGRGPRHGRVRDASTRNRAIRWLVKLLQLVMTDEAFHHKFGKIWADRTIPQAHRGRARTWSRTGPRTASRRCSSTWSRRSRCRSIYDEFGLDPDRVHARRSWKRCTDEAIAASA